MALNFTQITGSFEDGQGNALSGTATFTPNTTVYAAGIPVVEADVPIVAQIVAGSLRNSSGGTLQLLATDNTGISYAGQTGFLVWSVSIVLAGQVLPSWSFFLPHTPSPVDLFALANTAAGGFVSPMTTLGDMITGGASGAAARLAGNTASAREFLVSLGSGGLATAPAWSALQAGDIPQLAGYAPTGLTGATAASRYAGATVSGAPVSGTFAVGDFVIDQAGKVWICTAAGTPGTWTAAGPTIPVTIAQGGTGQTSQQAAINALTGTQAAGKYLRSDGANASLQNLQAADIPQLADYAPTGLTGATAASRYAGATASGPPASGTFAATDWVLDQAAGAIWVCVTAGTPGTWKQAGDQPHQFRPESYGAKGDVRAVSDAAITSGTNTLACVTSTPFTSTAVDGGKLAYIVGAGAGGADLVTTISTVTDSGHAVLAVNAGTTVSGKGCVFATNDLAAVKAAYAAAHAYALASPALRAQVLLSRLYGAGGAATIGGSTAGNALIPLTPVAAASGPKIRVEFCGDTGSSDVAELAHWLQPFPQMSGPGLVCLSLSGTNDATWGPASVIGGPYNGYGAATSTFSNMAVVLRNFRILVPFNSTFAGADFLGLAEDYETGYSCQALGIVPSGGAWPQLNQASITNQYTFGLRKGDVNNNARQDISMYSCEGLCYGFMASEHTTWDSARTIYCINGCELYAGATMPHGIRGGHLCAENCGNAVGVFGVAPFGNSVKAVIAHIDLESSQLLFDSNNLLIGSIGVMTNGTPGYGSFTVTGGQFARINQMLMPAGPVSSPQAPPASGSAWANLYYKDAWITLSATTITALTITGQSGTAKAQAVPSGAATYTFLLPSGCSYTPTYTGTLTHTVCPLSYT